jgi:pyruvate dehydrogenase E1 component beta subunit
VLPATPADAKGLLKTCVRQDDPVIFLEHESLYGVKGEVPEDDYLVPLGKANLMRSGKDITLISYSKCVYDSMAAADALENQGIDAEVIDLRSLNPLDIGAVLDSVRKTGKAIVVYEGWRTGGAGAEIVARIQEAAFDHLDAPVARVATLDTPIPYNARLERAALPSSTPRYLTMRGWSGPHCPVRRKLLRLPNRCSEVISKPSSLRYPPIS